MKLYIAGPMTGIPQFNVPMFDAYEDALSQVEVSIEGEPDRFEVINPARLDGEEVRAISLASPDGAPDTLRSHGHTHGEFLARDVTIIADGGVDAVVVLPGWEKSPGARHETFVAHLEGIPVVSWDIEDANTFHEVPFNELLRAWAGRPVIIRVPDIAL